MMWKSFLLTVFLHCTIVITSTGALLTPSTQLHRRVSRGVGSGTTTSSARGVSQQNQNQSPALWLSSSAAEEVPRGGEGQGTGTASIPNEVFNLIKCIVGAGVLSLPYGIAVYGNAPSAVIPAVGLISIMGIISGYTFGLIARVCEATGTDSYTSAWDKTVGPKLSFIIAFSCFIDCFAGNLSYSMILADTGKSLLQGFLGITISRTTSLLGITGLFLLPLCLLKNLSSLAPFSLVGILGMLYTTLAMAVRYFGKAYAIGGQFVGPDAGLIAQPTFGAMGASSALSSKSLILMCMLSNAYIAHFSAPKFLSELKNNTMARFNQVIAWSFGASTILYGIVSALGFLTFGSVSDGYILNNYSPKDLWVGFSRIAVAVSIICSYPLLFTGTRDGLLDLFQVKSEKRDNALINKVTFAVLAVVTLVASKLRDLGLVASVGGATFGTALVFVYPTIMFIKSQKVKNTETKFAALVGILGVIMGAIGTALCFN